MQKAATLDEVMAHLKIQLAACPLHLRQFYSDRLDQLRAWKKQGRTPDKDANVREACEEFIRLGKRAK